MKFIKILTAITVTIASSIAVAQQPSYTPFERAFLDLKIYNADSAQTCQDALMGKETFNDAWQAYIDAGSVGRDASALANKLHANCISLAQAPNGGDEQPQYTRFERSYLDLKSYNNENAATCLSTLNTDSSAVVHVWKIFIKNGSVKDYGNSFVNKIHRNCLIDAVPIVIGLIGIPWEELTSFERSFLDLKAYSSNSADVCRDVLLGNETINSSWDKLTNAGFISSDKPLANKLNINCIDNAYAEYVASGARIWTDLGPGWTFQKIDMPEYLRYLDEVGYKAETYLMKIALPWEIGHYWRELSIIIVVKYESDHAVFGSEVTINGFSHIYGASVSQPWAHVYETSETYIYQYTTTLGHSPNVELPREVSEIANGFSAYYKSILPILNEFKFKVFPHENVGSKIIVSSQVDASK
ncbi:hypothetical protein [Pelagibaculum spongiae]|uniref:Uncharacterized protein n=1 Tax=Pelagibaculum spongiae TaxID=2080658 RepID=A0A2V1H005_9GAMM|nr:hypothetical protein [Pelagibaculum spongiae]PVZ68343.1 hypothetical protein DC094_13745 [Pelagibaculum spongiae]